MTDKKYYRTVIHFEVLSDEPLVNVTLADIEHHVDEGHMSGAFLGTFEQEVDADQMASLLEMQQSDPCFLLGDEWATKKERDALLIALDVLGGRSIELAARIDELTAQIAEEEL